MRREIILLTVLVLLPTSMLTQAFGKVDINTRAAFDSDKDLSEDLSKARWSLNRPREWGSFAYVDEDSAEIVIGISGEIQNAYSQLKRLAKENGGKIVNTVSKKGLVSAVVADIPFELVSSFVGKVSAAGLSQYIEPNLKCYSQFIPNDTDWGLQWGPKRIQADLAWDTTSGNSSILVAIVDSGIDYDHTDLATNYVPLGYDWVNNDPDPKDDYGHGTHVAGIIAAVFNNGEGIAGMAQVKIMAEKALDQHGGGPEDDLANAIIHAADQGARVISNSWGLYTPSSLIHDAIEYAYYDKGVLIVAAAGNAASTGRGYPAGYDEVIAVTASDMNDNLATFSNYGDWVDVAAPGVDIYSTMPTYHVTMNDAPYSRNQNYDNMSGTSMAAPHVSGTAALIWSRFPSLTRDQVKAQLIYTADDLGDTGYDMHFGYGRINAKRAVEQLPAEHDLVMWNVKTLSVSDWMNKPCLFDITVFNFGANPEANVQVQLLVNSSVVNSTSVAFLPSGTSTTVCLSWNPSMAGTYNVTAYTVPVTGESFIQNNMITRTVTAKGQTVLGGTGQLIAEDPADQVNDWADLRTVNARLEFGKVVFEVTHDGPWIIHRREMTLFYGEEAVKDIIYLDTDRNPNTGMRADEQMDTGMDYAIVVTWGAASVNKWNQTAGIFDKTQIPVDFDVTTYTKKIIVSVRLNDIQVSTGFYGAVLQQFSVDWMPNSGAFNVLLPLRDVAVTNTMSSKTIVGQDYSTNINVTVANQGAVPELVNVTVNANSFNIQTKSVIVTSGASANVLFLWNTAGFAYGNYILSAYAWVQAGETDTADNTYTGSTVLVTIPGDINGDRKVDIRDLAYIVKHQYPEYNPNLDINSDGIVNQTDIDIASAHYGQSW